MKRISLAVALIGILLLIWLLNYSKPIKISSETNISELKANQKILIKGKVTFQTPAKLTIDNKLDIYSEFSPPAKDKNILIMGIVEEYDGKKSLSALRIRY